MGLQVVFDKISCWKKVGVKDGAEQVEEHEFLRGQMLPDWLDPFQAFVLVQTGMAKNVGETPDPNIVEAKDVPAPVILPEHSAFAVQGTDITRPAEVVRTVRQGDTARQADADDSDDDGSGLPPVAAAKEKWEDAATAHGMDRAQAESMKKAELVAEVRRRRADGLGTQLPPTRTPNPPTGTSGR